MESTQKEKNASIADKVKLAVVSVGVLTICTLVYKGLSPDLKGIEEVNSEYAGAKADSIYDAKRDSLAKAYNAQHDFIIASYKNQLKELKQEHELQEDSIEMYAAVIE